MGSRAGAALALFAALYLLAHVAAATVLAPVDVSPERLEPSPSPVPRPVVDQPVVTPLVVLIRPKSKTILRPTGQTLNGVASYYAWHADEAAAGPPLRAFLGSGWRGQSVRVCRSGVCRVVRLTDYCGCPNGRIIDLDTRTFAALGPLSAGLINVTIWRLT